MKHYSQVVDRREVIKQVLDRITCDWCGKEMDIGKGDYLQWGEKRMSVCTQWEFRAVNIPPDWQIDDLCEQCSIKLHELLLKNGIKVHESQLDVFGRRIRQPATL